MKEVTEKQIGAIMKLAHVTKTEVSDIESMSRAEASALIDSLIEKARGQKGDAAAQPRADARRSSFQSDALAGLAVKIVAQRNEVKTIIEQRDRFKERVAQLYAVFSEARQACLAFPSFSASRLAHPLASAAPRSVPPPL